MHNNKSFKWTFFLLTGIFVLGCATLSGGPESATPTLAIEEPIPSATDLPSTSTLTDEEIINGIQTSLDIMMQAYADNNVDLLNEALDVENKAFSRFVKTRFTTQQESFYGGGIELSYQVMSITRREYDLILAHIAYNQTAQVDWVFRQLDDGHWVLTEPTVEQTGEKIIKETEFFKFRTYPWADDINAAVEQLMQNARDRVEAKLGKVPTEKIAVEIIPTYGLYPFDNPNALAYYSYEGAFDGEGDRMVIYAPNSFLFGWYMQDQGWEQDLENVLTHEYTHMTHARSFNYVGRLADWIVEGLAEYVDGVDRAYSVAEAMQTGSMIPLVDTRENITYKQDLAHLNLLESDVSLAYAEAESLVTFIVEENGGFDAFWAFAQAYNDESGNLDKALQNSLNMTQTEFEKAWEAWLISDYLPTYAP